MFPLFFRIQRYGFFMGGKIVAYRDCRITLPINKAIPNTIYRPALTKKAIYVYHITNIFSHFITKGGIHAYIYA